ncbi:MAG: phage tail tape measure protein [Hydrogenophaga sp.]|nr:phage tail tape measure protein [Hydrogenophaga sp.]MDZ4129251.1 phage tail tape measure protein [Hydrogenophaga sp.]
MAGKDIKLGITIGADARQAIGVIGATTRAVERQADAAKKAAGPAQQLGKNLQETGAAAPKLLATAAASKELADGMRRVATETKAATEAQKQAQALAGARAELNFKPQAELVAQISKARAAYEQLRASGTLTTAELSRAHAGLQARIAEIKKDTGGWAEQLGQVRESAVALLAVLAGFAASVKVAAGFESAMVDFARATNQTKDDVMGLGDGIQALAQKYGMAAAAVAGIATVGAKLGVAQEDLNTFVEAVAQAAFNFEMLPEEAAKALGMLSALLKIPVGELAAFAGAINAVADGVGVMERDIIGALARAGASARDLGLSREQTVAMAAAMIKLGADAESAGSAVRTFSARLRGSINDQGAAGKALQRLVGDVRGFAELLYTDGQAAVTQFFTLLNRMPGPERFAILKDIFQEGLDTENINKLATGTEVYAKALEAATGDAESFTAQLQKLTEMKLGTVESEFAQLGSAVANLGIAVGTLLLPPVRLVTMAINGMVTALKNIVQAMPVTSALVGALATLALGAGALRLAMGAVALLWGRLAVAGTAAMAALAAPLAGWVGRTVALQGAKLALGAALRALLGPVGLVIAAVEVGIFAYQRWGRASTDAAKNSDAAMKASAVAARTALGEVATQVDAAASVVSDRLTAAFDKAKTLAEALPNSYKAAAQTIKDQYTQAAQGIEATLKDRLASVKGNAAQEAQAVVLAEGQKLAAADAAARQTLAAWEDAYGALIASGGRWVADAAARTAQVAELDRQATTERLAALQQWESAYRQTVDRLVAEERRHLDEVRRIEAERANVRLSTEDRIRELARKGLDEVGAFADRRLQVEQKQAAARVAIEQGQFEQGRKLAQEAMALAERNAVVVKQNGQEVVSQAQASAEAIRQINVSAGLVDTALARMADGHTKAAAAARTGAEGARQTLAELTQQVDTLQTKLAQGAELKLYIDSTKFVDALNEIDKLAKAREYLLTLKAQVVDLDAALALVAEKGKAGVDVRLLARLEGLGATVEQARGALVAANINVPLKFDGARAALNDFAAQAKAVLATPTESTHTVGSNVGKVRGEVDALQGRNTESTHTVYVRQVEQRAGGGLIGGVARLAAGGQALGQAWSRVAGRVFGPGTGTSDSVPAMLSAGEFVVKASSVQRYGVGLLQAINSGSFAMGAGGGAGVSRMAAQAGALSGGSGAAGADNVPQMRLLFDVPGRAPVRLTSARDKARDVVDMLRAAGLSVQVGPA